MFSYSSKSVVMIAWALLAAFAAARSCAELSPLLSKSSSSSHSPANRGRNSKGAMHAATADGVILFSWEWEDIVCIIFKILQNQPQGNCQIEILLALPRHKQCITKASIGWNADKKVLQNYTVKNHRSKHFFQHPKTSTYFLHLVCDEIQTSSEILQSMYKKNEGDIPCKRGEDRLPL